jgi:transcriptional regulator GlxA family with amidase domain
MHVLAFAFNGVQLLDVVGPTDLLTDGMLQAGSPVAYAVHTVSVDGLPVAASNGVQIVPDSSIDALPWQPDTVLIPGAAGDLQSVEIDRIADWLRRHAASLQRVCAVCGGAFIAGAAGLLDGREVTTHWRNAASLARRFPKAVVRADRILLRDDSLYTTGGGTAAMDLALALIEEDFGRTMARQVARQFAMFPKREHGQLQFAGSQTSRPPRHQLIDQVKQWVRANLDKPLSCAQLALEAGMSCTNFSAMFVRDTRLTPDEFVARERVARAAELLAQTGLVMRDIARACGFGTVQDLRVAFTFEHRISPWRYRANVRRARA